MPRPGKTAMLRLEPLHRLALRLGGSATTVWRCCHETSSLHLQALRLDGSAPAVGRCCYETSLSLGWLKGLQLSPRGSVVSIKKLLLRTS